MFTHAAHEPPLVRAASVRNWARSTPAPIRSALALAWYTARLEWPQPVARVKRLWQTRRPSTYDEKIRYKMARDRRPLLTTFADKLAARDYVTERVDATRLLNIHDRSTSASGIRWSRLPEEYVVKVNHGSGGIIIVSRRADRSTRLPSPEERPGWSRHLIHPDNADPARMAALSDYWLTLAYGWTPGSYAEWAYVNVTPMIFVEEYVAIGGRGLAPCVKVHCFNGIPVTFTVTSFSAAHFEEADARFLITEIDCAAAVTGLEASELSAVVRHCRALSEETDFVRVDWLITPDGLRFGELTNYPAGGQGGPMGLGTASPFDVAELYFDAWTLPRRYTRPLCYTLPLGPTGRSR